MMHETNALTCFVLLRSLSACKSCEKSFVLENLVLWPCHLIDYNNVLLPYRRGGRWCLVVPLGSSGVGKNEQIN